MKKYITLILSFVVYLGAYAQVDHNANISKEKLKYYEEQQNSAPKLEYVMELLVKCEGTYEVGPTVQGRRVVIPIVGGTFEGPRIKGEVIPGGADYQKIDDQHNRTELEAIYSIRTDDGVNIHVRNCGILTNDENGFYFRLTPKFEAPWDSKYSWLNNGIYICVPGFPEGFISLKIYKVLM